MFLQNHRLIRDMMNIPILSILDCPWKKMIRTSIAKPMKAGNVKLATQSSHVLISAQFALSADKKMLNAPERRVNSKVQLGRASLIDKIQQNVLLIAVEYEAATIWPNIALLIKSIP